jgi:predicted MFS family arabinose efflux permease
MTFLRGSSGPRARGETASLVALGLAGLCTFLNVYATQPLLPLLERAFGVGKAQAAWTVSAPTIAVALASPFAGALADRVGRRRLMIASLFALAVPTALAGTAHSMPGLIAWRFAQGLVVPGVYAVAVSYISEVWQGRGVGRAMSALVTGNVLGGFLGRLVAGLCAESLGWRAAFLALGVLTAAGAVATARWLPPEPARAAPAARPLDALRALAGHLDARLLATFAVGFNVLFSLVATFTYVTFHLSGAPFHLGAGALSSLFVVYLIGAVVTPFAGRWIDRVGSRQALSASLGLAVLGALLTLVPSVLAIGVGLACCCTAAFASQAASTSYLQVAAPREVRSAASGVYVSAYYLGGSAGGVLPAVAWHAGGWPACVALAAVVQLVTLALALRYWRGSPAATVAVLPAHA